MEKKNRTERKNKIRIFFCALLGGLFLSVTWHWGRQLDSAENVNFMSASGWLRVIVSAAAATLFLYWLFQKLPVWICKKKDGHGGRRFPNEGTMTAGIKKEGGRRAEVRNWLFGALALFCCWLPVFLAVYPGFFSYDATEELREVESGSYVTRHPLVHVLLLGKTVSGLRQRSGSYNTGIAVYVLVQMAVMALLLSWVLQTLKRLGAGKILCGLGFFFLAFFPVVPMYVLCTSKDMPYTAGMLAVLVLLCLMGRDREKWRKKNGYWVGLGIALTVMALFRNNGFYVFLVMIPVLLLLAKKDLGKRMALTILAVLVLRFSINFCLDSALMPESTDTQETLTVPIQQLARTWKYSPGVFSEEDREALFAVLPQEVLERYNSKLSDLVKIDFQTQNYEKDPKRFWSLWLRTGIKAPFTYVNAWFMTSYGFWYPFTVIDVYNGTRSYESSSYFSCETEPPGERQSRLPWLEKKYEELSWEDSIHRMPAISWLFSPGFLCWIYVLAGLFLLSAGRTEGVGILAPVYLNWLTVLLGPTYLVRYVLIFWFALPLLPVVIKWQMCYTSMDNAKSGEICQNGR